MTVTLDKKNRVGQYLTFILNNEIYAVDVRHAQTVLEHRRVTRIPRMPEFVLGVIDFRGRVVPLINLKQKLGLELNQTGDQSMIVIIEIPCEQTLVTLGITADAVQEVITLENEQFEDPPSIGMNVDLSFIRGIAKKDDQFILVLKSESILDSDELTHLKNSVRDEKKTDPDVETPT